MSPASESLQSHLNVIPKLAADGSNWITYKERMFTVMGSRGLLRHLQGTARRPPDPPPLPMPSPAQAATTASTTPAATASTAATSRTATTTAPVTTTAPAGQTQPSMTPEEYLKIVEAAEQKLDEYTQKEFAARQQIYGTINDRLLLRVKKLVTVAEVWIAVQNEYESKSEMYSGALRTRLQNTKCEEGADARAHLDTLAKMREELASMGAPISDADFTAHVFASLPESYSALLQALSTAARIAKTTISADDIITSIVEEYDRRKAHLKPESALSAKADTRSRSHSKSRGHSAKSKDAECYNCGRKGHFSRDCWREGGGKEGQGPKDQASKKGGSSSSNSKGRSSANTAVSDDNQTHAFTATFDSAALVHHPATLPDVEIEVYDSGATRHMTPYRDSFVSFEPMPVKPITAADGRNFSAIGRGTVQLQIPNGEQMTTVLLEDVLYAPEIAFALISIARADAAGYSAMFEKGECRIYSRRQSRIIGRVPSLNGLYKVEHSRRAAPVNESASVAVEPEVERALISLSVMDFHRRMGHISPIIAERLVREGRVEGVRLTDKANKEKTCNSCIQAKITRATVPKERESDRTKELDDRVHSDVWGPAQTETLGGKKYFTSFTDDATRWTDLYLLRAKSGTFSAYKSYEAKLKNQDGKTIKALQSDRGGEYLSREFTDHLTTHGTVSRLTVHDTPQHNGLAERINRTLPEHARAMLIAAKLPKNLWGEAMMHATWLKNRTSTRALDGKTPFEVRYGHLPDLGDLHEFGAKVWVRIENAGKLDSKAREGRFVGYSTESKGYRVYWPDKHAVSVERNVRFIDETVIADEAQPEGAIEAVVPSSPSTLHQPQQKPKSHTEPPAPSSVNPPSMPTSDAPVQEHKDENHAPEAPAERSHRPRKASAYVKRLNDGSGVADGRKSRPKYPQGLQPGDLMGAAAVEAEESESEQEGDEPIFAMPAAFAVREGQEPRSLEEAMQSPDWPQWQKAIEKEMRNLRDHHTYDLVEPPENTNVVGSKFVFRIKRNANGKIESYKARLVAQGFSQIPGIDFNDTFAPVAKLASIRIILALAAHHDWDVHQMDVKGAYLNADLEEEIFMKQPPGQAERGKEHWVCVRHAIYGLKQSGRQWFKKMCAALDEMGLSRSLVDHCVFYLDEDDDSVTLIIALSVDDTTIAGTNNAVLWFKTEISKRFEMTDLGEMHWILGIEVRRDRAARTLSLSQRAYIDGLMARFNLEDAKPLSAPLEPGAILSIRQCPSTPREFEDMRNVPYREAIGSLMYAALGTRPDIAFAVTALSQFMQNPGRAHWEAAKRVLRYLKSTREKWLTYGLTRDGVEGFSDADWGSSEHRHSICGYVFLIDGGAVSWSAKKQPVVALSSTEAEYIALTHAAKEAIWVRYLLADILDPDVSKFALRLHTDNRSAIALAKDNAYHARTKHIDIRYHFIREAVDSAAISLLYRRTEDMPADIFTKSLPRVKVEYLTSLMGLHGT
ncbi:hypothetical protein SCP_0900490 [Sparassis crispa]|uniref:Retrovirus-related Pol polyprotein from transposon TNT 1-94 n=1 Tax=Sparassis crispa TaxID=139825 RepID=A0A401GVE5_9APHY|nr:hypothetical protein SCP_0900490 [Sparassis crispa]GBE86172.1 hypothetical protein SCP_0900490 [Sparassis crispa]